MQKQKMKKGCGSSDGTTSLWFGRLCFCRCRVDLCRLRRHLLVVVVFEFPLVYKARLDGYISHFVLLDLDYYHVHLLTLFVHLSVR